MILSLNKPTFDSLARALATEGFHFAQEVPEGHPLKAEIDEISGVDRARLNTFLSGVAFAKADQAHERQIERKDRRIANLKKRLALVTEDRDELRRQLTGRTLLFTLTLFILAGFFVAFVQVGGVRAANDGDLARIQSLEAYDAAR